MWCVDQADYVRRMRAHLAEVYERTFGTGGAGDLQVALEDFQHYTSLVRGSLPTSQWSQS